MVRRSLRETLESYCTASGGEIWPAWYLNSHDNSRSATRYDEGFGTGDPRARAAAVLLLTLACTPLLYQGEELGLADVPLSAELKNDVIGRDSQRTPFPWESPAVAGPGAGFTSGEPWLPLGDQAGTKNRANALLRSDSILNLYRNVIRVRRASLR